MDKQKEFNLIVTPEQALANFLECDVEEAKQQIEDGDYLVLTDEEADEQAKESIIDYLLAFKAGFILSECGLDLSGEESLKEMQGSTCEGAQDFIYSLIDKTCGIDSFVESAISADGRGHFLASYDSEENAVGEYYIYRIN